MSEGQMGDEHLRQQFQDNLPNVDSDHAWARLQARLDEEPGSGSAKPLRRRRRSALAVVAVGAGVIVVAFVVAAALGLFGGGSQMASVDVTTTPTAAAPDTAAPTSVTQATPPTSASPATTQASGNSGVTTTSERLLFPAERSFIEELSGDGYQAAIVTVDRREGATFTVVWIAADPNKVTPATYDAIFDQAVTLAEKYGAADTTEGRLKVELFDSTQGGMIKDLIFESRDFNLEEKTTPMPPDTTSGTPPTTQ